METIALIGLITAAGMYFTDKTPRNQEHIRNLNEKDPQITKMSEIEKPNSLNIYHSDKVNTANDEILARSLKNYKDAETPALTGMLPPIYNAYSTFGHETILQTNIKEPSSIQKALIDDNTKRNNVFNVQKRQLQERPMFKVDTIGTLSDTQELSNFGAGQFINEEVSLLTGKPIEREHSNMIPFFGSNIKQNTETFTNVSKLDQLTGNTSTYIHKQEISPQFEPFKQDITGTPALTDNIDITRFIPSAYRQNEKPFYEDKVAAPIAGTVDNPVDQNFNRTIDQLRVANKPQITYEARTNSGQMGSVRSTATPVMKHRPDTHYELGEKRFFTSTGAVIADHSPYNFENLTPTSRTTQNIEYYGSKIAKDALASGPRLKNIDNTAELDFSSLVQTPKRSQLPSDTERNLGTHVPSVHDYGKSSYNLPDLERDTTKQSYTLNLHQNTSGQRVALQDEARSTIKETLVGKIDNTGNITSIVNKDTNTGITDYSFKTTNKETVIINNYKGQANKKDQVGYNIAKYNAKITNKEISSLNSKNYTGSGKAHTPTVENRTQYHNAEITEKKETLLKNTRPNGRKSTLGSISGGVNVLGDVKTTPNMLLKEQEKERTENIQFQNITPSKQIIGKQETPFNKHSELENTRINSTIVQTQLKQNPFYNLHSV